MKSRYLIILTVIFLQFFPFYTKAEDLSAGILPYYESGMLMGAVTRPIEIVSEEGHKGKVAIGYLNVLKNEGIFLKILPDTELFEILSPAYDEIMMSRYTLMEFYPETMGIFGTVSAPLVQDARLDVTLNDGRLLYRTGKKDYPMLFNAFNIEYAEDFEKSPLMMVVSPSVMYYGNSDKDPKFKDMEKTGVKEVKFQYGDHVTDLKFTQITPELISALKKAFKGFK